MKPKIQAPPAPWRVCTTTGVIVSAHYEWRRDRYAATIGGVYGPDGEAWDAEESARAAAHLIGAAPQLANALERYISATAHYLPEATRQAFCGLEADARQALDDATNGGLYDLPTLYSFATETQKEAKA